MLCRDRKDSVVTELIELGRESCDICRIGFVCDYVDGFSNGPQPVCKLLVETRDSSSHIYHEQQKSCLFNSNFGLFDYSGRNLSSVIGYHTSSVHKAKRPSLPFSLGVDAVPRNPGEVADDRSSTADNTVEESRLANIRPSNDCDQRRRRIAALRLIIDLCK